MTTLYQLLILANYSIYDSTLLPYKSVYDYPLPVPIISTVEPQSYEPQSYELTGQPNGSIEILIWY